MRKYQGRIIAVATILVALVAAWFYGGHYPDGAGGGVSPMMPISAVAAYTESGEQPVSLIGNSQELPYGKDEAVQVFDTASASVADLVEPPDAARETDLAEAPDATGKTDAKAGTDKYRTEPVPEGRPIPVEPQDTTVGDGSFLVTIVVRCDTILDNMRLLDIEKQELLPEDGLIYPMAEAIAYEGESVFTILHREMKRARIHLTFRNTPVYNSAYIEAINNLYEFDVGELSGWMYSVNGWYPNYGCSRYQVKPGDVIEWVYTCDLGRDLGQDWLFVGGQRELGVAPNG